MLSFARVSLAAVAVFTASAVSLAQPAAAAPPRTLAVAKDKLGADTFALVSANGKTLRATQLFTKLFAKAMREADVKKGVELLKSQCNIDPMKAIDDATVGFGGNEVATVFVALSGVGESEFTSCVAAIAKKESGKDIKATKKGGIIELTDSKGADPLYVAWLPGDILAFSSELGDRAELVKGLGGGFAKSALAPRVAKLNTDAPLFGALRKTIRKNSVTIDAFDFAFVAAGGKVTARFTLDTGSAADAEKAGAAMKALAVMFVPKSAPKEVHAIAKSLVVINQGANVTIEAKASDAEILKAIEWATQGEPQGKKKPSDPKR